LSSFQSGFFIYIPKNLVVQEPIRIVYSLRGDGTSSICRNVVISDVGSKATVVQELYSSSSSSSTLSGVSDDQAGKPDKNKTQQCYFEVLECGIKPASELEFVTLQAMDLSTVNVSNRKAFVEQDGKMSWYSGMFGTSLCRYKTDSTPDNRGGERRSTAAQHRVTGSPEATGGAATDSSDRRSTPTVDSASGSEASMRLARATGSA
jgi:Fe-S cluster assembly scaffold protein SufB